MKQKTKQTGLEEKSKRMGLASRLTPLKKTLTKYALPILAATTLTMGTYAQDVKTSYKEDPKTGIYIPEGTEKPQEKKYQEYKDSLLEKHLHEADLIYEHAKELEQKALAKYQSSIEKGHFSYDDSEEISKLFREASKKYCKTSHFAKKMELSKYQDLGLKPEYETIRKLCKKAPGWDFGKAELEKALEEEGYDVDVESGPEGWIFTSIFFGLVAVGLIGGGVDCGPP